MCSYLSHTPYWGSGPKPRLVPQTRNLTADPLVPRQALIPLSHRGRATFQILAVCSKRGKNKTRIELRSLILHLRIFQGRVGKHGLLTYYIIEQKGFQYTFLPAQHSFPILIISFGELSFLHLVHMAGVGLQEESYLSSFSTTGWSYQEEFSLFLNGFKSRMP